MQVIGLIGLGKKGYPLAQALQKRRIKILGFDLKDDNRLRAANNRIVTTSSISGVVMHLPKRKIICLLLEDSSKMEAVIARLEALLIAGDIIIDLGDTTPNVQVEVYNQLKTNGIHFLVGQIDEDAIEIIIEKQIGHVEPSAMEACRFLSKRMMT